MPIARPQRLELARYLCELLIKLNFYVFSEHSCDTEGCRFRDYYFLLNTLAHARLFSFHPQTG